MLDVVRVARWISHLDNRPDLFHECPGSQSAEFLWILVDSLGRDLSVFGDRGALAGLRKMQLYRLLCASRERQASEPRDHVYGVLGLRNRIRSTAELSALSIPQVDYRAPIEQVFSDATRAALTEVGGHAILAFISHRSDVSIETTPIPSWALPLGRKYDSREDPSQFYHQFNANDGQANKIRDSHRSEEMILTVSGIGIDRVVDVCAVPDRKLWSGNNLSKIQPCLRSLLAQVQAHTNGRINHGGILMTLMAGLNLQSKRADNDDIRGFSDLLEVDKVTRWPLSGLEDRSIAKTRWDEPWRPYNRMQNAWNRSVFITQAGSIGLGPKLTKAGDIVAIIYGCRVPVVLRPCGEEYRFVGICYFEGVMDGEAMRMHKEIGGPDVEFRIR